QEASLENLLIETDAPVKYGLEASEPKDVLKTLVEVSKLKGVEMEQVADKTLTNFSRLYQSSR
ncbi:MAG: TatD family hydrolase, partial [Thermoproteota archaeon]